MKLETAELIARAGKSLGLDIVLCDGYSGRGMFGAETTALHYDRENDLIAACVEAGRPHPDPAAFVREILRLRSDKLGWNRVAY